MNDLLVEQTMSEGSKDTSETPERRLKRPSSSIKLAGLHSHTSSQNSISTNDQESNGEDTTTSDPPKSPTRKLREDELAEQINSASIVGVPDLDSASVIQGWMNKCGEQSVIRKWKKRWVVVAGTSVSSSVNVVKIALHRHVLSLCEQIICYTIMTARLLTSLKVSSL